jgi:hypothetical protein
MLAMRQAERRTVQEADGADHVSDPVHAAPAALDQTSTALQHSAIPSPALEPSAGSSPRWRVPIVAAIVLGAALAFTLGSGRHTASGTPPETASTGMAAPLAGVVSAHEPAAAHSETNLASTPAPDALPKAPSASASASASVAAAAAVAAGKSITPAPGKKAKEPAARKTVVAHTSPASADTAPQAVERTQELPLPPVARPDQLRAAVTDPSGGDPRRVCAGGNFLSKALCMNTRCAQAVYSAHDECVRLRKLAEDAEMASLRGG